MGPPENQGAIVGGRTGRGEPPLDLLSLHTLGLSDGRAPLAEATGTGAINT